MNLNEQDTPLAKGIAAAEAGQHMLALFHLETAAENYDTPRLSSYRGYCIAVERRQFRAAAQLCRQAISQEPQDPTHYLNLGRVFLAAGQKGQAIRIFQQGLKYGRDRRIIMEIKRLGNRKTPPIAALSRGHIINRYLGLAMDRLGWR